MCRIGMVVGVLIMIAIAGLPAGMQAQGGDDGLVAEWHFDEGSGSVLHDSSGNGNDGVIHGATWVEGKCEKALRFDGRGDFVEVPDDDSLDLTNSFTISLWIKQYGSQDQGYRIVDKTTAGVNDGYSFDTYGCHSGGRRIRLTGGVDNSCAKTDYSLNEWHHLAVVFLNGVSTYYLDGVYDGSGDHKNDIHENALSLRIGYGHGALITNEYFNGIIDEVRIYNRALTADEIKSHYEGKQTALSLTKSASPHSIKQGQTTAITLTVKNTGTTEITDIEVSDTIPSDLTFVSGETSKTYTSLRPKDSREFQYTLQLNEAGTFNIDPATATYADEEGNYHTAESKTVAVTVIPSMDQPTTPQTVPKSSAGISTASVHLHGEKTDVVLGEDVLLKLSAVNIIGNPLMHVQVIIIPPSGWSVASSAFAKTGAGQYTTTYDITEGVGRDIEVRIMPNQIGDDFHVQGRIIYYFGDDSDAREDHTLTLPITVRAEAEPIVDTSGSGGKGSSTPGFGAMVAVIGVLLVALLIKRRGLR